jgi:hypothetical protein
VGRHRHGANGIAIALWALAVLVVAIAAVLIWDTTRNPGVSYLEEALLSAWPIFAAWALLVATGIAYRRRAGLWPIAAGLTFFLLTELYVFADTMGNI